MPQVAGPGCTAAGSSAADPSRVGKNVGVIIAAADGSSLSNPGPAGWCWYIDAHRWASGGWPHGTNNMGELMAVLDLLRQTRDADDDLTVLCDSQYAINCCTKWIRGWKRNGWVKADKKPVLNRDLLEALDVELTGRSVRFEWVKGHAGHPLNEAADERARAAALAYQNRTEVPTGPGFCAASRKAGSLAVVPTPRPDPEPDLFAVDLGVQLGALERELLTEATLLERDRLVALLDPLYVAHLPGGAIRTRGSFLARPAVLDGRVELDVLGVDELDSQVALLRYRIRREGETLLGASVWVRHEDGWRLRFRQLTPA